MFAAVLTVALALNPPGLVAVIGTPAFRLKEAWLLGLSPDGKRLYTGHLRYDDDQAHVMVLDADKGRVLTTFRPLAQGERLSHYEFAPEGLRLLILGASELTCCLRVIDPDTGRVVREGKPWRPPGKSGYAHLFNHAPPDGQCGPLFRDEETTRPLDAETGKVTPLDPPLPHDIRSAHASLDGRGFAAQLKDGSIRVHDLPSGKRRVKFPADLGGEREIAGFTPDGHGLAVWVRRSGHWSLEVRDPDGKLLHTLLDKQPSSTWVVFDPTGKTFAATNRSNRFDRLEIRDATNGRFIAPVPGSIFRARYSPDGKTLWTERGTAGLLVPVDATNGWLRPGGAYPPGPVRPYQFRGDGQLVGVAADLAFTWDPRTGRESARVLIPPSLGPLEDLEFDPAGVRLRSDPILRENAKDWSYRTGAVNPVSAPPEPPDGKGAMLNAWLQVEWGNAGFDGHEWTLRVLPGDKADGRPKPGEWRGRGPGPFGWPHLAPGEKRVVMVRTDRREDRGEVTIIDVTDPKSKPARLAVGHDIRGFIEPEFSPDGRWAAVAGVRMRKTETSEKPVPLVSVFDLNSRRRVVELGVSVQSPSQCSFSPDGRLLAVGGDNGEVALVETTTWKERTVVRPPRGTENSRGWAQVRWSLDGKLFATTTPDERIAVWDVARLVSGPPK